MKSVLIITALIVTGISSPAVWAQSSAVYTGWRDNNAAGGYDVTTFFDGVPQKGKREFTHNYNGARWMFTTQTNRDEFIAAPDTFAPAYGGYCAWAVAHEKLAKGNPKYWNVEDGRLYFNFNARIQTRWLKGKPEFIVGADDNWPAILED